MSLCIFLLSVVNICEIKVLMKEKWKLVENGRNPSDSFTGGNDGEEPLYVGRVQFGGQLMPGETT